MSIRGRSGPIKPTHLAAPIVAPGGPVPVHVIRASVISQARQRPLTRRTVPRPHLAQPNLTPRSPVAIVQVAQNTALNTGSVVATFATAPAAGNLIVACFGGFRGATATMSPLTWTQDAADVTNNLCFIFHTVGDGSTTAFTCMPSFSTADDAKNLWVAEVSGLGAGVVDVSNSGHDSGGSPETVTMAATSYANELWVGLVNPQTNPSAAAANGWTVQAAFGGAGSGITDGLIVATKVTTALGTPSTQVTWKSTGGNATNSWAAVTYRAASVFPAAVMVTDQAWRRAQIRRDTPRPHLSPAVKPSKTIFGKTIVINGATTYATGLSSPRTAVFDAAGNLWIPEYGNGTIQVIPAASGTLFGVSVTANTLKTIATASAGIWGLAFDTAGNLYVSNFTNSTLQVLPVASGTLYGTSVTANTLATLATGAPLNQPSALAIDNAGNIFVANSGGANIVVLPVASGTLYSTSVTANTLTALSGTSGLSAPRGVTLDAAGNLYYVDYTNNLLAVLPKTSSTVFGVSVTANTQSTLASGSGVVHGPRGIAFDAVGNLYLAAFDANSVLVLPATTGFVLGVATTANTVVAVLTGGSVGPSGIAISPAGDLFVANFTGTTLVIDAAPPAPPITSLQTVFAIQAQTRPYVAERTVPVRPHLAPPVLAASPPVKAVVVTSQALLRPYIGLRAAPHPHLPPLTLTAPGLSPPPATVVTDQAWRRALVGRSVTMAPLLASALVAPGGPVAIPAVRPVVVSQALRRPLVGRTVPKPHVAPANLAPTPFAPSVLIGQARQRALTGRTVPRPHLAPSTLPAVIGLVPAASASVTVQAQPGVVNVPATTGSAPASVTLQASVGTVTAGVTSDTSSASATIQAAADDPILGVVVQAPAATITIQSRTGVVIAAVTAAAPAAIITIQTAEPTVSAGATLTPASGVVTAQGAIGQVQAASTVPTSTAALTVQAAQTSAAAGATIGSSSATLSIQAQPPSPTGAATTQAASAVLSLQSQVGTVAAGAVVASATTYVTVQSKVGTAGVAVHIIPAAATVTLQAVGHAPTTGVTVAITSGWVTVQSKAIVAIVVLSVPNDLQVVSEDAEGRWVAGGSRGRWAHDTDTTNQWS